MGNPAVTFGQGDTVKKFHIKDLKTNSISLFTVLCGTVVLMYRDLFGATGKPEHHQSVTDAGGCHSIGVEFNSCRLSEKGSI